jgi:hypothetical protein
MKPPLKRRVPKPRNPYVPLVLARKAGEHQKTPGGNARPKSRP